jgi:hypothetical protein
MLLEQRKNRPHKFGLFFVHHQPSAVRRNIIAEHRASSHPFPLPPCRRHFVARAFADQFPFELRETQKNKDVKLLRLVSAGARCVAEPDATGESELPGGSPATTSTIGHSFMIRIASGMPECPSYWRSQVP